MALPKELIEMVEQDINRIESELKNGDDISRWKLFREMDGKYQSCIKNFYEGMWLSVPNKNVLHFPQLQQYPDYVVENLEMVQSKLLTYRFEANAVVGQVPKGTDKQNGVTVTVNNHVNINITFEEVREKIEDMTSLTDHETKEILDKINEIETVINSNDKKKTKWEKVKPILTWLADKSFDVGVAIMPLLLKI